MQRLCVRSALCCGERSMEFHCTAVLMVHQINKSCFNLKTWNHKKWAVKWIRSRPVLLHVSRSPSWHGSSVPLCLPDVVFILFVCFHVPAVSVCVWSACLPPYRWDHAAGDQAPAGRRHHRAASPPVCLAVRYVTRRRRPAAHRWSYQPRDCDALN